MMADERNGVTRRRFGRSLARAGAAAAVGGPVMGQAPSQAPAQPGAGASGPVAPNDQLVFGGIGIRTRGMYDLTRLVADARVRFVAVADVRESARENVKSFVDKHYGNNDSVPRRYWCLGARLVCGANTNVPSRSSRPRESHPEPLTEPCLSLSTHTARATH